MKKVIFLDIDGVLTTVKSRYCLDREKMKLLGEILEKTGAWVVVSSSWRGTTLKDTIFNLTNSEDPHVGANPFPYTDKIIGMTPILGWMLGYADTERPALRGEEIEAYLKMHPCDSYVILDDERDMISHQLSHLVLTDDEEGLNYEAANKCIEILNKI